MHALRDTINVGYKGGDDLFFESQRIIRSLVSKMTTLVKPLSGTVFESAKQVCLLVFICYELMYSLR